VSVATQIFAPEFDETFFRLPSEIQKRVEEKLFLVGLRINDFPHYRMTGSNHFRLRVGDYRVIYRCVFEKTA